MNEREGIHRLIPRSGELDVLRRLSGNEQPRQVGKT